MILAKLKKMTHFSNSNRSIVHNALMFNFLFSNNNNKTT